MTDKTQKTTDPLIEALKSEGIDARLVSEGKRKVVAVQKNPEEALTSLLGSAYSRAELKNFEYDNKPVVAATVLSYEGNSYRLLELGKSDSNRNPRLARDDEWPCFNTTSYAAGYK